MRLGEEGKDAEGGADNSATSHDCLLRVTSLRACGFVAILYIVESLKLNPKRKLYSIEQPLSKN